MSNAILKLSDLTIDSIFAPECKLDNDIRQRIWESYQSYDCFCTCEDAIPYDRNPRLNEDAVSSVADSICNYGFQQPLVLDNDRVIIVGHTRRLASNSVGINVIPVIIAKNLTPEQIKAYRIDDNKTGELSTWDFSLLQDELIDLEDSGYDLTSMAFDADEMERILSIAQENIGGDTNFDDEEEDTGIEETETTEESDSPDVTYDSVPGGVYQLGKHRLVCGDCTDGYQIAQLFDGDGETPARLWLSDPPYNCNYSGRANKTEADKKLKALRNKNLTLANDNMSEEEFMAFINKAFMNCIAYLGAGDSFYLFHSFMVSHIFKKAIEENDGKISAQLIWAKNHFALSFMCYMMKHEPIWFGWKNGATHKWYGNHDDSTTTIQKWKITHSNNLHPSMKPIDMLEFFIKNSSKRGEIVMDTFGGSGSTMIACENTGRICRMMELMPKYADVIRKRWAEQVHGEGCDWKALTPKIRQIENLD